MTVHVVHEGCGGRITIAAQPTLHQTWLVYAAACSKCKKTQFGRLRLKPKEKDRE